MKKEQKYYYGNEISQYGLENGRVDYATLAKCFDAVLNNDIMRLTYDIGYWDQVSGIIDNTDEIEELEEKLAAYEKGPIVVKPHNKVVLEVFVKLLEKSGADLKKHGNKAIAARLAETITTLPLTTCQNYFSDRLKTTAHSDEIVKINILLKNLGIEWQL